MRQPSKKFAYEAKQHSCIPFKARDCNFLHFVALVHQMRQAYVWTTIIT